METKHNEITGLKAMYAANCPTRQILDLIGDKWTVLIVGLLEHGPMRFSELQRTIDGISHKMLAQTLRNLERDGLVSRQVYAEVPPRVDYTLTPLGETLWPAISAIQNWADTYIGEIIAAQQIYDTRQPAVANAHR